MTLAWYSFSKLLWLFRVFLCFHIHFRTFYFCEKCHWNFDRDCIKSVDCFGYYGYFNNINLIHEHGVSFHLFEPFVFLSFFYQHLFFKNWNIIVLQCCVSFCSTISWVSHMYTYVHVCMISCFSCVWFFETP